jgi:hypothetical protein
MTAISDALQVTKNGSRHRSDAMIRSIGRRRSSSVVISVPPDIAMSH